jgi:hypothetical protein
LVPSDGGDKVTPGPEVLTYEVALPFTIDPCQMDALFPLMKPTTCDTAYFGGIEINMCT